MKELVVNIDTLQQVPVHDQGRMKIVLNLLDRLNRLVLRQQPRGKLVYWKPHDSVQLPRVSRYGLKTFLCISWNSCGVLYERLLEMILMVTP